MVKIKGGTSSSLKKLKSDLKKTTSGNVWVKSIPGDDELVVRFLTEPVDWFKYDEHYVDDVGYFACIGDDCPGCAVLAKSKGKKKKDGRISRRYLANALDVSNERVIPLKLPATLATRLVARAERKGTIIDRDYVLTREGTGLDTEYDAEAEDRSRRKLDKYELLDLEDVLVQQFEDAFGDAEDDDDEEEEERSTRKKKTTGAKRLRVESEESEDEDDEEEASSSSRRRTTTGSKSKTASRRRRRR